MRMTRRGFLKAGAMAGLGVALPVGAISVPSKGIVASGSVASPNVKPFQVPLPVPPTLEPVHSDSVVDHYEMVQRRAEVEIIPGTKTEIWGYDGIFPGPTIEARSGREAVIRQTNELPVPVSTHLHGGKISPESDGYPTDLILPNGGNTSGAHHMHGSHAMTTSEGFKDYVYPNEQRGATLWYHDHRMDFTGPQNYRGLVGMYIIRDEIEDELSLPQDEKEVPLIIADRIFEEDGSFYYPSIDPTLEGQGGVIGAHANGVYGDTTLVNGAPWPEMEVSNTKYRFRILNASNARVYDLALDPQPEGRSFVQIGSDGGLLEAPIPHDSIRISPAERFDVVVDFGEYPVGTEVVLKNLRGAGKMGDVMRFVVTRSEEEESEVPDELAPKLDFPEPKEAETTRRFEFQNGNTWGGMSLVNGEMFDPDYVHARPSLDSTEVWEFVSDGDHPVHLHLVHFEVISRNGGPPGPYDAGWKDTVYLEDGEVVRVAAKFEGYRGKYVFHCHNLEHEDMMMMANFEVI